MKLTKKINLIAPILRGLLAKDTCCPIVRFQEEGVCQCTCAKATLPEDAGEEQAIEL